MEADILDASSEEEKKRIFHEYQMWKWNFPYSSAGEPLTKSERAAQERASHAFEEELTESMKNGET